MPFIHSASDGSVCNATATLDRATVAAAEQASCIEFSPCGGNTAEVQLPNDLVVDDLRVALDQQQLFLMYQPIVSLRTAQIHSFEALLRWNHPVHGLIPPDTFIPHAEASGMILPIGNWVLRTALSQFAQWRQTQADAAPCCISVNMSRVQLQMDTTPAMIEQALSETGVAADDLHLEITESAVMNNTTRTIRRLHEIKEQGVKLDLDDFGTGYSSLACLQQFPIDVLKLDRLFTAQVDRHRSHAALVQAVTDMAMNLNITVVAEGIESTSQMVVLQAMECDYGQGYLFGRPLNARDVPTTMLNVPLSGSS